MLDSANEKTVSAVKEIKRGSIMNEIFETTKRIYRDRNIPTDARVGKKAVPVIFAWVPAHCGI